MAAARRKRPRKRHVQQELFRRGGKRKGAGRKAKGARAGTSRESRPTFGSRQALHVVLRIVPEVGNMRRRKMYKAIRDATVVAAVRERIRIVHVSIQATHIHMIVEADSKLALARGMQGFQISVARNVNSVLGVDRFRRRRGRVFADRYHVVLIGSPTQARHTLSYVMNNWRRHQEDKHGRSKTWLVDPFSSGFSFPDWKELQDEELMWRGPESYEPLVVYRPRSWLLHEGWKKAGTISAREVPRPRR
jgi:REP element-mobilizing transposase RayT